MIRFLLLICFFHFSAQATAQEHNNPSTKVEVPQDKDVLTQLTYQQSSERPLPLKLNVMSWNVHKGADKEKWAVDIKALATNADIIALEEAMRDDFMPNALSSVSGFSFWLAQSFLYKDGRGTGVATGAKSPAKNLQFSRSPDREPVLNTPKMTLFSTYTMEDGKPILVANLHGINFVLSSDLERQLEALRPTFEKWTGRILFLGDFNTWSSARMAYLDEFVHSLNMNEVKFVADKRKLILDHIFVRGCKVLNSRVLDQIKSSDHEPLWAALDCH